MRLFAGISLLSMASAISMLTGCGGSASPAPATLQSIAVTPAGATLVIGGTQQYKATATYSDSSTQDLTSTVTWSSDTPGVAAVSSTGMATGMAAGSANIIATSGSIHGQAAVTVPAVTLQSIAVTATSLTIAIGSTQQFKATGTYSDSSTKDITNSVTWSSDNTAAATVSSSGLATGVAAGSVNIIATSGGIHGQAAVTVPAATLQSIAVTATSLTIAIGSTQQFKATGTYSDSSTKDITSSVTWSSDNTAAATVSSSGLATGVAAGSANVIATSGSIHGQAAVTVPAATLQSIAVTATSLTIAIGSTQQFKATGTYSDSSTKDITAAVTWSSDNTAAATVSSSGLATGVAAGSADIIATGAAVNGQATVTVPPSLQSIAVASSGSLTIAIGGTQQLTATGTYSDSSTKDLTSSLTWSSDNTAAATVSSSGLVTAVAQGSADIIATSGTVHGQATVTVPAATRSYSGTASVGDFLTISISQSQNTITYTDTSNGATGTATYMTDFNGNTTLNDPAGHLLSLSEVPGYGIVALMNNAGPNQDQLALVTSVTQQSVTLSSFENHNYNMMEFRTQGGGVGIASVGIDGSGNISLSQYMPFNLLSTTPDKTGFDSFVFPPPSAASSQYYLTLQDTAPPIGSGLNYIFGTSDGKFLDDSEDGSMIGLPKASSPNFDPSWAGTYDLTYYEKTSAYGPDGNSPEAGNVNWGVATLALDKSGNLSLTDGQGHTMATGLLVPVVNTPALYGTGSDGKLSDPCYGLFTFSNTDGPFGSNQTQQVFVAFTSGTVLLSSFSTNTSYNPGNDYNYFYGVGLPATSVSTAPNTGSSSSNPTTAPAWNSLGTSNPSYVATAPRYYVGSSATGDLLTIVIDPNAGTLAYYDVNNGNTDVTGNSADLVSYSYNSSTGLSAVSDANGNVLGALELPGQALMLEMANTGFNLSTTASDNPPVLVMATPQMNLTATDFEPATQAQSQSYNFLDLRASMGDQTIGSMTIDSSGNLTGNGFSRWGQLAGANMPAFANIDPLAFPGGTYPQPWVVTTDPSFNRSAYLFGYPSSLLLLSTASQGTLIGVPQNSTAAFQPSPAGASIAGTYAVMIYRRQVTGIDQQGNESGPSGTPASGVPATGNGGWKTLPETGGASMGLVTLVIDSAGHLGLKDPDGSKPWYVNNQAQVLQPVSSNPALYGTGTDGLLTNPCDGLYTLHLLTNSGALLTDVYIGFVPGTTPAVVFTSFAVAQPLPSVNPQQNYQYRFGIGFLTSTSTTMP
jgi:uncharacterized protein YjdB